MLNGAQYGGELPTRLLPVRAVEISSSVLSLLQLASRAGSFTVGGCLPTPDPG